MAIVLIVAHLGTALVRPIGDAFVCSEDHGSTVSLWSLLVVATKDVKNATRNRGSANRC